MKKIILGLAAVISAALMVSCASKQSASIEADDTFAMFMDEDDGLLHLEYKPLNKVAKGNSYNKLKNVKIIANKDYSKATPEDLYCDAPELVEFCGEECVKLSPNGDGNIRTIWLFDKPIPASSISTFTFNVAGLDIPEDNTWSWNIALMYNDNITSGEHATAMYTGPMSTFEWTTTTIDLNTVEGLWGNNYKPEGEFLGIQLYYGGRDPIFIRDLEVK